MYFPTLKYYLKLPDTVENLCNEKYGEAEVEELGEKYSVGESPIISCEDLKSEWLDFRIYMLSNCGKMSMKGADFPSHSK